MFCSGLRPLSRESFSINTISNCSYVFCEGLMRIHSLISFRCLVTLLETQAKVFCSLKAKKLGFSPPSFCSTSTSGAKRRRGCYRLICGLRSQGAHSGTKQVILGDLGVRVGKSWPRIPALPRPTSLVSSPV